MKDYPDVTNKHKRSALPERLQYALETFAADIQKQRASSGLVALIVDQMARLPVSSLVKASREIQARGALYRRH